MKYYEIVAPADRACRDNNTPANRTPAKSRKLGRKSIEAPINRLYKDLMEALEDRMTNVRAARALHQPKP
jgi:hypothetical protein